MDLIYKMFSNNNNHTLNPNICFPFPLVDLVFLNFDYESTTKANTYGGVHAADLLTTASGPILATSLSTINSPKLQGKIQRSAVNGHLSIASILANAFQLHGFPRGHVAINHAGKLGLTFSQIDIISKRLTLIISSLALLPGSDCHVSTNNDGDAVVMIILEDEEYVDERLVVLIIAILRVGATYMVVSREQVTSDQKYWQQLMSLIEPILVVTMIDPHDLPTAMKNDLNLFGREHFDDYQTDDDLDDSGGQLPLQPAMVKSLYESETGSTTEVNPFQASTLLVKKIRSSIIMKPSTYLKSPTVSCKVLWDLAMELKIVNEKDLIVPPFRADVGISQRTAFIFQCDCTGPHTGVVQQWCKLGHKAIRNRISWERIECPIKNTEKICLTFPLNDPRSLVQIFNCFIHGRMLIIGEPGEFQSGPFLLRKLSSDAFKNVQRLELTTDRLQDLLEYATQPNQEFYLNRIKVWLISTTSSSSLTPALAKQFYAKVRSTDVLLFIMYGTPEMMYCSAWNMFSSLKELNKCMHLEKDGDRKLFLGTAAINTTILVIDSRKSTICPAGHRGEICVLGSMVPVAGYCGSTILGKSISIFQTGDMGRFVQDKGGNLQLVVESNTEGQDPKRKVMVEGKLINLDDLAKIVKHNSVYVREAFAFICQRGRDIPEIVLALALKDQAKFDSVQEVVSTKLAGLTGPLALKCFPVVPPVIPRLLAITSSTSQANVSAGGSGGGAGPVDVKNVRAAYFKHLGRSNPSDWYTLFPAKGPGGRNKNPVEEQIEKSIQIICKAVAFSLGISLGEVITNYENSFWDLGGTPIRAIMTVKSCLCQGKRLTVEDFMVAAKISELGFRMIYAEKNESKWFYEIELARKMFSCNALTNSDHEEILDMLIYNFSKMLPLSEHKQIEKYAAGLIETFDNSLTVVASSTETHEILGIAFNYRGPLKSHFVPALFEEGLELYNSMLQSCRHLTQGVEIKSIVKSFIIALKTEALVHPSQVLLITRDLVKESMSYAKGEGYKGYLVCSMDPLVQEICCSLLGFETLDEIQLNLYRNKKFLKPFAHLDDHQVFGVYFAKFNA